MLSFHGKPGENHGKYTVRELLSSCYLFSRRSLRVSPVASPKKFWGALKFLSSSAARPKGSFCPARPYMLPGVLAHPSSTGDIPRRPDRVRSEAESDGPDASLTRHMNKFGERFWVTRLDSDGPQMRHKETTSPNVKFGALWATLWGTRLEIL
jgi:hypothetical protein